MKTSEELLSDRSWRVRNSLWMLWGILSAGFFSFIGFGYTGARMRDLLRILIAAAGVLIVIVYFSIPSEVDPTTGASTHPMIGVVAMWWIATTVAGFFLNRKWLIWKANHAPQWPTAQASPAQQSQQYAAPQQFATPPPTLLDLNLASREQLLALPGINAEWADFLIAARERNGGFDDRSDLLTDVQLPPHMYLQIRDLVTASPRRR